jgi:hypothetical protein
VSCRVEVTEVKSISECDERMVWRARGADVVIWLGTNTQRAPYHATRGTSYAATIHFLDPAQTFTIEHKLNALDYLLRLFYSRISQKFPIS